MDNGIGPQSTSRVKRVVFTRPWPRRGGGGPVSGELKRKGSQVEGRVVKDKGQLMTSKVQLMTRTTSLERVCGSLGHE